MPAQDYKLDTERFNYTGIDLNHPIDALQPGKFAKGQNIRVDSDGSITNRPGINDIAASVVANFTPVHSCRRLNDPRSASWTRIVGVGTQLAYGQTSFTNTGLVFSGNPLSLVPWRPESSPDPWMYVGDSEQQMKIRRDGTLHTIGLPPPTTPPNLPVIASRDYKVIDEFDATTGWTQGGTAGAPALLSALTGVVAGATNATPIVITDIGHGLSTGDSVLVVDVEGNTAANGGWVVIVLTADTFSLVGSAGNGAYTANGTWTRYRTAFRIQRLLFETGTTGWAWLNPYGAFSIGQGERIVVNPGGGNAETVTVQQVFNGSVATTIAGVVYETGTAGYCSIVLTDRVENIQVNSLFYNSTIGELVRVIAVTVGPDGTTCLRVFTVGTFAATNAVQFLPSVYVYLANAAHAADEDVVSDGVYSSITTGAGTLSRTVALDLSTIASGVASSPDDYVHISIRTDRPDLITEGKILLDVDSALNDFTRNFYFKSFRASDITPVARNLQSLITTRSTVVQRNILDTAESRTLVLEDFEQTNPDGETTSIQQRYVDTITGEVVDIANLPGGASLEFLPGTGRQTYVLSIPSQEVVETLVPTDTPGGQATSEQMASGDVQWFEFRFRLSDFTRIGADETRSLQNIAAISINLITTGTVVMALDSWWLGSGYAPDTGETTATGYLYRYRARHPTTNVASNFSPTTRFSVQPLRQKVTVGFTQYPLPTGMSGAATDFVLDVERFGGNVAGWRYIATIANAASPSLTDTFEDIVIAGNPELINDNYQPWPIISVPVSGTTTSVCGTLVNTGASLVFNTAWAPGTRILINDVAYTIYRVLATNKLELVENAGSQGAVTWRIDEPTILGQPLPYLWETDDTFFACGDTTNPGRLYYSNRASETTKISISDGVSVRRWGYLDITSPSEPLMNGVTYNARSIAFSSERMFQIRPTGDPLQPWTYEEIPNGKGLFANWALTRHNPKAPWIAFLGKDGIYKTEGGSPVSLTDRDLYPLFPHEGNIGGAVNDIQPPNIVLAQNANLRLEFYDDFLYFDYLSTVSVRNSLVYDLFRDGWFFDDYTPGIVFHYGEEGPGVHALLCGGADATTGILYQQTGSSDNGTAIDCILRTGCRDQGDPRLIKQYGDLVVNYIPNGITISAIVSYDNHTNISAGVNLTAAGSDRQFDILNIDSGDGIFGTNIDIEFNWSVSIPGAPYFYLAQFAYLFKPENIQLRYTDWDDAGYAGSKWVQGFILEADTFNVEKTIRVKDSDTQTVQQTFAVTHNGQVSKPYSFTTPFIAHSVRLEPTDVDPWRLFRCTWIYDPIPELTLTWATEGTSHGLEGFQHLRHYAYIALISSASVTLTINVDGTDYTFTVPSTSSVFAKVVVPLSVMKGKVFRYSLANATGFRLFRKDCEIGVRPWGDTGPYRVLTPFGGESFQTGAQI